MSERKVDELNEPFDTYKSVIGLPQVVSLQQIFQNGRELGRKEARQAVIAQIREMLDCIGSTLECDCASVHGIALVLTKLNELERGE